MGIKITDMVAGGLANGTEIVPTSKAAAPRSVTTANVKDYTIDQIEAIAAGVAPTGADSVYALQGGVLKPIDIDLVSQYAIDLVWAKVDATPAGANLVPLKAGGVEKTMTVTNLAEVIRGLIEAAILDVSNLSSGAGAIATSDYMLVTQGTTGKRIQISDLSTLIYASLAAHVTGKTALADPAVATDVLYILRGGVAYKVTLSQLATYFGGAGTVTGSGTSGYLTKWSAAAVLTDGPAIVPDNFAAGTNDQIPTALAVRTEMNEIVNDATDIGVAVADADTVLLYDASATAQKKGALSRFWTYVASKLPTNTAIVGHASYTVAGLPSAATAGQVIYVSNEVGGAVLAFADGAAWRRVTDRTIVA